MSVASPTVFGAKLPPMTEIADRYRRLSDAFAATIAAVPDDRWSSPSPCEDWTARDVVGHVVASQGMFLGFVGEEVGRDPVGRRRSGRRRGTRRASPCAGRARRPGAGRHRVRRLPRTVHVVGRRRPLPQLRPRRPSMGPRPGHRTGRHHRSAPTPSGCSRSRGASATSSAVPGAFGPGDPRRPRRRRRDPHARVLRTTRA